jgi:8-amino-7-oxononanoate synthase
MLAATSGEKLILTDGVFSMDGDEAGVAELAKLSQDHGAWLLVDDAHGLGVHGPQGAGTLARAGLKPTAPVILMGTLGKALGTFGAFVAGNAEVIELLTQRARTYIYTTALPPAVAAATREGVRIAHSEETRRETLRRHITALRTGVARLGLNMPDSATPIQPLILGDDRAALAASAALREQGILVPAIRPPTVPEGQSRLRVSLSAAHTDADIGRLLAALAKIA